MSKEKLIKELQRLEKFSKEASIRYIEKSGKEWKYNSGIMFAIGWLQSGLELEDYYNERLNDLSHGE